MARIVSFGHEPQELKKKLEKRSFFKTASDLFFSVDTFTRRMILIMILIVAVTPAIVASYMIFNSRAASTGGIDIAISSSPAPKTGISTQTAVSISPPATDAVSIYNTSTAAGDEFTLINNWRKTNGLSTLTAGYKLTNVADWMGKDMGTYVYLSHWDHICKTTSCAALYNNLCQGRSTCGEDTFTRMGRLGYNYHYTWTGENVGWASTNSPDYIFNLFKASPEHNANMLSPYYNAVGISSYTAVNGNTYWAVEFGTFYDTSGSVLDTPITYSVSSSSPSPSSSVRPTLTPVPTSTPISSCVSGINRCVNTCQYQACISGTWSTTQNCSAFTGCYNNSCQVSAASTCPGNSRLSASTFCQNTASGIKFGWSSAPWATSYNLYYTNGTYTSPVYTTASNSYSVPSLSCITGPGGCSFSYGANIVWYVRACNASGTCSPFLSSSVVTQNCSVLPSPTASGTPKPSSTPGPSSTPPPTGACTNGYKDLDGDGYGTGTYGCYTGTVASLAGDCCDSDSRAHPGQTAGFTFPNNCGSYDYNCDGSSTTVGTYYASSGLISPVRLNCTGGTCGSCTNGNYTPPFTNSYSSSCGQTGGSGCTYAYFNPGQTYCPASGTASYRAGCTSTTIPCN